MYYAIETILRDNTDQTVIQSMKRSGTKAGRAQSFTLARQLVKDSKEPLSVLIYQVDSQIDVTLVAFANPSEDLLKSNPNVELIEEIKYKKLLKVFREILDSIPEPKIWDSEISDIFTTLAKVAEQEKPNHYEQH